MDLPLTDALRILSMAAALSLIVLELACLQKTVALRRPLLLAFLLTTIHAALFILATIFRARGIWSPEAGMLNTWSMIVRLHWLGTGIGIGLFYLRM